MNFINIGTTIMMTKQQLTAQQKTLVFWFATSTVGLFCFQAYAIYNSATSFGASVMMAALVAGITATIPDAFAWVANLKNLIGWRKIVTIGVGVVISSGLGVIFSTMTTPVRELQAIYMLVQFGLIVIQVLTADVAIEALHTMPTAKVRMVREARLEAREVLAEVDANNDLLQKLINEKFEETVRIITDAIPDPQPLPEINFSQLEKKLEQLFDAQISQNLELKKQREIVEKLQIIEPPKKRMSASERAEWVSQNVDAYTERLGEVVEVSPNLIKKDLVKSLNGNGAHK